MAVSYTIAQHDVAFPSKVLAREGGRHILNIKLKEDCDQGWICGKGAFVELDLYDQAAPTTLTGTVLGKAANGNWYVEIASASNAFFVYNVPMIETEYNNNFLKESNFYNKQGDVVRAYELAQYDVIEVSSLAGTVSAGTSVSLQTISGVSYAKKLGA